MNSEITITIGLKILFILYKYGDDSNYVRKLLIIVHSMINKNEAKILP